MKRQKITDTDGTERGGKEYSEKKNRDQKRFHRIIAALIIICLILAAIAGVCGYKLKIPQKIASHLGWIEKGDYGGIDYAIEAWNNCLDSIDYGCNAAFFGDSIIGGGEFDQFFDDVKICNLGYPGDTLFGMKKRVDMIGAVHPEKVFFMGGINSLLDNNMESTVTSYSELLDKIKDQAPDAEIYVHSVLPIGSNQESKWYGGGVCKNETIRAFNQRIKELADERGITYVDLYPLYEKDGQLNPDYTKDGIHIRDHYEPWVEVIRPYIYSD